MKLHQLLICINIWIGILYYSIPLFSSTQLTVYQYDKKENVIITNLGRFRGKCNNSKLNVSYYKLYVLCHDDETFLKVKNSHHLNTQFIYNLLYSNRFIFMFVLCFNSLFFCLISITLILESKALFNFLVKD